ncbi:MAG: ion channel [Rhodomicrobium sp.]
MTTLTTIVVHGLALIAVLYIVTREYRLGRAGIRFWRDLTIIATVTQVALVAHVAEMAIWAVVLSLCGEFTRFAAAFCHSAMNYTSLGYGDVVMSASWKLLGPLEAANGLLLFGVSTAMIFAVIQRFVRSRLRTEGAGSP